MSLSIRHSLFTRHAPLTIHARRITANARKTENGKRFTAFEGGFTIVELIITIVIMGIIIPAVTLALNNLSVINRQARDLALSNMVAQNKVETLRSQGYNAVPIGTISFTAELPSTMGSPKSASYTISSPQTGVKQIDVSISYTDYNKTRNLAFRTYVSELGVGQ